MQKINKFYIVLLVAITFISSCNAGEYMNTKGHLVYTSGDGSINSINLNSSSLHNSPLYKSESVSVIDNLTRKGYKDILFGECPIAGECIIKHYSVDKKETKVLRTGKLPSYIDIHDKLFFYDEVDHDNNWLFVSSIKNIKNAIKVSKEPKKKTLPNGIKQSITTPVIQISNSEVIFVGEDERLWLYNIMKEKIISTDINNCRPILWVEKQRKLLCSTWDTWTPFLLDLNTKNQVEMPILKRAYGFTYIPEDNALIYGKTRSKNIIGEAYDIFLYSFSDNKEKRIMKDSHISSGVWLSEIRTVN